jgi:hypothetical protein
MKFDPESAKAAYAQKESDELVRIAFLEGEYLEEAKRLAKGELARRGQSQVDSETVERVRADIERQRTEKLDAQLQGLESEDEIPSWRQAIRSWLAPHRDILSWLAFVLAALCVLNSALDWGMFALDARKSKGIASLLLLIWLVFLAPSRREFKKRLYAKNADR